MAKVYAVKEGKKPGVYNTWAECQEQTKGYSGAIYKAFKDEQEARDFVYGKPDIITAIAGPEDTVSIGPNEIDEIKMLLNMIKGTTMKKMFKASDLECISNYAHNIADVLEIDL